jgi:hypothetical protein
VTASDLHLDDGIEYPISNPVGQSPKKQPDFEDEKSEFNF